MKPVWLTCVLLLLSLTAGGAQAPAEEPLMFVAPVAVSADLAAWIVWPRPTNGRRLRSARTANRAVYFCPRLTHTFGVNCARS